MIVVKKHWLAEICNICAKIREGMNNENTSSVNDVCENKYKIHLKNYIKWIKAECFNFQEGKYA